MPNRADLMISNTAGLIQFNGGGTNYIVQTPSGVIYMIYIESGSDVHFKKSSDGGMTWSNSTSVFAGTATALAIWYDRWSNISAGLIHMAYVESVTDDVMYRTINTESSDALSTQTILFAGASTATGGCLSIVRAVGGNVYCRVTIDAAAEGGFYRLPTANVPNGAWDAARTIDETMATTDQIILQPDFDAADTQDIMAIFWDASADEISRKLYDDSANTWGETSIAGTMVDQVATTAFPHFACAPDISGTKSVLVAWSAIDAANADLRCWTVDSGTITEVTNVVQNGTDDQGLAGICIDTTTGYWHVFYAGKSDGSETFLTSVNIYTKVSMDSGSTWGPETKLTNLARDITWLTTAPRWAGAFGLPPVAYHNDVTIDELYVNVPLPRRRASHQLFGG